MIYCFLIQVPTSYAVKVQETNNSYAIHFVERKFKQEQLCIDPESISVNLVNSLHNRSECTILEQTQIQKLEFETSTGVIITKDFRCKLCRPVNCKHIQVTEKNCSFFNKIVYATYSYTSEESKTIHLFRYGCTERCQILPVNQNVKRILITRRGKILKISTS